MKRLVRIVCLIVVVSMFLAVPAVAEEQTERASNFFSSHKAYCYEKSSTELAVFFSVIAVDTMDELGARLVKVQRSSNGSNWTTVKTFTKESYPQMIDTDAFLHGTTLYCTKTSGYYYRAYVEFYAKNSTGTGERYYYTAII